MYSFVIFWSLSILGDLGFYLFTINVETFYIVSEALWKKTEKNNMETNVPCPTMDWTSDNLKEAWKRFKNHVSLLFQLPSVEGQKKSNVSFY